MEISYQRNYRMTCCCSSKFIRMPIIKRNVGRDESDTNRSMT